MLPDRVSNPGPLTYESGVLPIALRGPARYLVKVLLLYKSFLLTPGTTQRDDTWSLKFHIEGKGKEI